MARIDSLLSLLEHQGADELRLGTDREPKTFALGNPKRLSIPSTPEGTLRELLGEILTPERERAMAERGHLEVDYETPAVGAFHVKFSARPGGGFDVVFRRGAAAPANGAGLPFAVDPAQSLSTAGDSGGDAVANAHPDAGRLAGAGRPAPTSLARLAGEAKALRASDLHLADGRVPMVRVDGRLRRLGEHSVDLGALLTLDPSQREALARGCSSDLALDVADVGRMRVHVFSAADGLSAAVRLLPGLAPSIESLQLPLPIDDLVELSHGLVLICGASGSGKSTTLAALAREALRRRSIVLTTLEDPIEYALEMSDTSVVRRRQIGRDVPDFATGLRDALREDPDVLLVGEMRDPETIGLALTAAETGHLVLSSLHSGSAASAIERIVDAYAPGRQQQIRVQLADSLRAVVAQRLLPRARGTGRVAAVEVLRVTHAVGCLIREGKTPQIATALQSGKRERMISLERCLADLVHAGEVTLEDARSVANERESLAMYLTR